MVNLNATEVSALKFQVAMNDQEFIDGFEDCTLPADGFHHEHHVKVAWLYLQRSPVLETLARFSANLKRFATANGKPNLYHETITWAYVFLINERIKRNGSCQSWEGRRWARPTGMASVPSRCAKP